MTYEFIPFYQIGWFSSICHLHGLVTKKINGQFCWRAVCTVFKYVDTYNVMYLSKLDPYKDHFFLF